MPRSRLALLLLAVLLGCQRRPVPDPQAVRQAIEASNARRARWYVAGEADSLVSLFAEDVWQLPPNMAPVVGLDSLRAFWTNAFNWGRWEFARQTEEVVVSGAIAVERGRYTLTFTAGPQGPIPPFEDRGNYVVLWRQDRDGQWRAVWDAPVSELHPSAAPLR
jgi:ketosteroid isomerase-like protein